MEETANNCWLFPFVAKICFAITAQHDDPETVIPRQ